MAKTIFLCEKIGVKTEEIEKSAQFYCIGRCLYDTSRRNERCKNVIKVPDKLHEHFSPAYVEHFNKRVTTINIKF